METTKTAFLGGLALAAIAVVLAPPAQASPINYVWVQNGGLTGMTMTGGFTYDSATGIVTNFETTFDNGIPNIGAGHAFWEGTYVGPATLEMHFGHPVFQFNQDFVWDGSPTGDIDVNVAMGFVDFVDGGPNYLWSGAPPGFTGGFGLGEFPSFVDPSNPPYAVEADDTNTPEPATWGMMMVALAGAGVWTRAARRSQS